MLPVFTGTMLCSLEKPHALLTMNPTFHGSRRIIKNLHKSLFLNKNVTVLRVNIYCRTFSALVSSTAGLNVFFFLKLWNICFA